VNAGSFFPERRLFDPTREVHVSVFLSLPFPFFMPFSSGPSILRFLSCQGPVYFFPFPRFLPSSFFSHPVFPSHMLLFFHVDGDSSKTRWASHDLGVMPSPADEPWGAEFSVNHFFPKHIPAINLVLRFGKDGP